MKPTRTAEQLKALVIERIEAIPDLQGVKTDVHDGSVVAVGFDGDEGPSWNVVVLTNQHGHR